MRRPVGSACAARSSLVTSNWQSGEMKRSQLSVRPKSGARHGAQKIVTIDDPMVNGFLLYLRNGVEPRDLVHPAGAIGLRAFFSKAVDFFLLHDLDRLRRSGATHDFLLHANLPKTILRGRWGDLRSARIYINDGLSLQAQVHLDPLVRAWVLHRTKARVAWRVVLYCSHRAPMFRMHVALCVKHV